MEDLDISLAKTNDDLKTIEHYTERYIPIKVQEQIMDNMRMVLTTSQMEFLESEDNKM